MKIIVCLECGVRNPKLELRDMLDDKLYVCSCCGCNAFEFYSGD